jgi:hypothetical protein
MTFIQRAGILIFVVALLNTAIPCQGQVLSGTGWGETFAEAKKEALGDLCTTIQVQVNSRFTEVQSQTGDDASGKVESILKLTANLPILGADFKEIRDDNGIRATAFLNAAKSGPLYAARLREIKEAITKTLAAVKKAATHADQHRLLTNVLPLCEEYSHLAPVARTLGVKPIEKLPISRNTLFERIIALEKNADSIDFAAQLITKELPSHLTGIYVYPPMLRESNEVTPFAAVVRECIAKQLKTVDSPDRADYLFTGRYEKSSQAIDLAYTLYKIEGSAVSGTVVRLAPEAFSDYTTDPKSFNLDKLLQNGLAVSNDFRVSLRTNLGKENLLFKEGQKVKLFVKSNRPAHFYLAGHIDKGRVQRCSYLLNLMPKAQGKRRFIRFINGDDVNKWISLGKFKAAQPFGMENLQIIASTEDLIDNLPHVVRYDPETKLYLIADDPEKGVAKTRALIPEEDETSVAEAVLTFTTMARMGKSPE